VVANFIPIAIYTIVALLLLGVPELYLQYILYLWLVSAVGVSLGLMLSSFDLRDEGVGTTLLPLVLVPQLILCGSPAFSFGDLQHLVLQTHSEQQQKIPEMAQIMPSRWAYEGLIALHLNNSRYGEVEKLEKLEADINTAANNNDFDKPEDPKALKGWKSPYTLLKESITALTRDKKDAEKDKNGKEVSGTGLKEGFFHPYVTDQLKKGVWDNNHLHRVQGRSTDLLQRYKSLPFVSNQAQSDDKDFTYLSRGNNQVPTEWYNAFVLVLLGLAALAITRLMIWYSLR
jgi:hypothetical protein